MRGVPLAGAALGVGGLSGGHLACKDVANLTAGVQPPAQVRFDNHQERPCRGLTPIHIGLARLNLPRPLVCGLCSDLLFCSRSSEDALHTMVPLVARVLEQC